MSEYVPTTGQVREAYIVNKGQWRQSAGAGFDAWLDWVKADARREGQAEAWDEGAEAGAEHVTSGHPGELSNPYEEDRHVDQ